MAVHQPVSGSFGHYASHYLGPLAGFLTGWTYTFEMVIVATADVTAFGIYMGLWFRRSPSGSGYSASFCLSALNLCSVKVFGELEFWLSLVKVAAIVAMIVGGAAVMLFGFGQTQHATGISNLWQHGGFMPNGIGGVVASWRWCSPSAALRSSVLPPARQKTPPKCCRKRSTPCRCASCCTC